VQDSPRPALNPQFVAPNLAGISANP